jgi:hypothetical protein
LIHHAHWERLASLPADDVCRRSGASYDLSRQSYVLTVLNRSLLVNARAAASQWGGTLPPHTKPPSFHETLFAVVYLLESKEVPPAGEWVTAETLPSGAFFFRGPHAVPTAKLAARFGGEPDAFLAAGVRLGGIPVEIGDVGVQLQVVPRIAVRLVLWQGDEELPSKVTMLFDRLVGQQLALDALHSMMHIVESWMLQGARDGT